MTKFNAKNKESIQSIISNTVAASNKLFTDGTISQSVASVDVMVALLIDANRGVLRSRSAEVKEYVLKFEEQCKYAKPVPEEVKALYRRQL